MSQKQLTALKRELVSLEKELSLLQHQHLIGTALRILPKVWDLKNKIAKLEAQR
jgi:hypothetical protein